MARLTRSTKEGPNSKPITAPRRQRSPAANLRDLNCGIHSRVPPSLL